MFSHRIFSYGHVSLSEPCLWLGKCLCAYALTKDWTQTGHSELIDSWTMDNQDGKNLFHKFEKNAYVPCEGNLFEWAYCTVFV